MGLGIPPVWEKAGLRWEDHEVKDTSIGVSAKVWKQEMEESTAFDVLAPPSQFWFLFLFVCIKKNLVIVR